MTFVTRVDDSKKQGRVDQPTIEQHYRLIDFLRFLRLRRWQIIGIASLCVLLATAYVFTKTPTYTATAEVLLDQRKNNITDLTAVLAGEQSQTALQDQIEIITSRTVAGRIVDALHLDKDPEFNGAAGESPSVFHWLNPINWLQLLPHNLFSSDTEKSVAAAEDKTDPAREAAIDTYLANLSAEPVPNSGGIRLSITSTDPDKAARIANGAAQAFVEDGLNTKYEAAQKTAQWLNGRLKQLAHQVALADAEAHEFRIANHISEITPANSLTGTGNATVVDSQLQGISGQLITAKAELAEKQAQYSRVLQLLQSGRAADVSAVVASPLIVNLRSQETELLRQQADLQSRYGPRHPKIVDLESQKANLDSKIAEEVRRVVETVKSDLIVAQARVGSLESSLGQTANVSRGQSKQMTQLSELEATASTARTLYQSVLSHYNDAVSQTGFQTPDSRVLSPATVPDEPSEPRKGRTILIGLLAGLMLGVGAAFVLENLDVGFRTGDQVEGVMHLPMLAAMPAIANTDSRSDLADRVLEEPNSAYTESVRGIALGLKLKANNSGGPKVVMVTSAVPGEGKTTLAASLARLVATQGQNVLLIDADLRKPALSKIFKFENLKQGVVEALDNLGNIESYLLRDPRSKLLVLPCARPTNNASELLDSAKMRSLVQALRSQLDLVVIDTAPMLPVHDSWVLTEMADAVVMAVRWEKTPREAALKAAQVLQDLNAPVAGVVLTRVVVNAFRHYNYGYQDYSDYGKYYNSD